ncbi:hypothetical protein AURDEDRAFT_139983 [Auricularia subglabra TFB-10046 SS5]|nr:hypothetical protein AURDEDRAFT_139983 [Auricularia subglabra TFB-10046 SS5]
MSRPDPDSCTNRAQVKDPFNPHKDDSDSDAEFALYAREVYNSILGFIFADCAAPSRIGSLIRAGDGINRIIHPTIHVASLDGLEAGHFCQCRGPTALHPYPTCFVHKDDLSKLVCEAPKRTVNSMRAAYEEAAEATGSRREQLLTKHGIHFIKVRLIGTQWQHPLRHSQHFLWDFAHSDPYAAYGYDLLHSDDLGKFGHHLWPLLRNWLKVNNLAATVNLNAAAFPPSPGLERFPIDSKPICKLDFSDGETFFSIEKRVEVKYGKNFNFFKQHATSHAIESIEEMGAAHNQSTRPGEGFIQEVKQQYRRTNGRDVEKQMTKYDTWGEAVASIRTAIMEAENVRVANVDASEEVSGPVSEPTGARVSFGAPSRRWEDISALEQRLVEQDPVYRGLDCSLRAALRTCFRKDSEEFHGNVKIQMHGCLYVHYASVEDFREARDILRCTSKWFGQPRFDCALFDDDMDSVNVHKAARLRALLKCKIMSTGEVYDVVAVTHFMPHSWKPRTVYRGCRVIKEAATLDFVAPEQLIRGAIVCPATATYSSDSTTLL